MFARALVILIGLVLPISALAGELKLTLNGSGQFDTNTARSDSNEVGDFSFRVGPTILVHDQRGKLNYRVRYNPVYQKFIDRTEFDKLSHFASGSWDYRIGNKTTLSLTESFKFAQSINQEAAGTALGDVDGSPRAETERGDVYSNVARFTADHKFTPRTSGQLTLTHQFFDSDNTNTSQNTSLSALTSLNYAVGARDRVGVGGGISFQQFDGVRGQSGSDTFTYRVFASWLHNFGQNTALSIRGGPALISTKQDRPDPEGFDGVYPHLVVVRDGSVDQVYADLGLSTPASVTDLSGVDLLEGAEISAGSILVPTEDCFSMIQPVPVLDLRFVSSAFPISPANCSFSRIATPDVDDDQDAFIGTVRSDEVDFFFPPGVDSGKTTGSTITFFGEVSLSHSWTEKLTSSFSYSRSDSAASSLGSSTIADRVSFQTNWEPTSRLSVDFRADWIQRKSSNEITNSFREVEFSPVPDANFAAVGYTGVLATSTTDNAVDTSYYRASVRAEYQFTRRMTLSARLTYQKQDTSRASTSANSDFGDLIAHFGVRYALDPFHF